MKSIYKNRNKIKIQIQQKKNKSNKKVNYQKLVNKSANFDYCIKSSNY